MWFFSLKYSVFLSWLYFVPVYALNITVVTYGLATESNNLNTVGLLAPAIQLGVRELEEIYGFRSTHVVLSSPGLLTCEDEQRNFDMVSEFYYNRFIPNNNSMFVIIFSGCVESFLTLSRLSREWNTLVVAGNSATAEVQNKTLHPTTITMPAASRVISRLALLHLFVKYSWSTITMFYDSSDKNTYYSNFVKDLQSVQVEEELEILAFAVNSDKAKLHYTSLLKRAREVSRIIILGFHATHVRTFMVYFAIEGYPSVRRYGDLLAKFNDGDDEIALHAYHQLFLLSQCDPGVDVNLSAHRKVLLQQIKDNGIKDYNASFSANEQPTLSALMSYLSVKVFAQVLNETLGSNDSFNDAASMAKRFYSRKFSFDAGTVLLDGNGESLPEPCFKRLALENDVFEDVLHFDPVLKVLNVVENATIRWDTPYGEAPPNRPICGYSDTYGPCQLDSTPLLVATISAVLVIVGVSIAAALFFKKAASLRDEWWRLDAQELAIKDITKSCFLKSNQSLTSLRDVVTVTKGFTYHGGYVQTTRVTLRQKFFLSNRARVTLSEIHKLRHNNIVSFLGLCISHDTLTVVYEFCQNGDLADVLDRLQLDWNNRASLIGDLIEGLYSVHTSSIKRHGYINPHLLFVNKRLTLQIGNVGIFDVLRDIDFMPENEDEKLNYETQARWTAPELRTVLHSSESVALLVRRAGPEADVYSLGSIIMFVHEDCDEPNISAIDSPLIILACACLKTSQTERPNIVDVRQTFRTSFSSAVGGIAQNLVKRMERYAAKLEEAVVERTHALLNERRLCHELLMEMMPSAVVIQLLSGNKVDAEKFDCVTVLISYIVGFTDFVAKLTEEPAFVVTFLNRVFTTFDRLLNERDIYKVETISDTYMVVSGLPVPNGDKHASEICELAVALRQGFDSVAVTHESTLQLTVGINSGPCAAGIIGEKRPRYCLFGATVNTASRLASHGEPSKIHVSGVTAALVRYHYALETISRGAVHLKGIGNVITYWLEQRTEFVSEILC